MAYYKGKKRSAAILAAGLLIAAVFRPIFVVVAQDLSGAVRPGPAARAAIGAAGFIDSREILHGIIPGARILALPAAAGVDGRALPLAPQPAGQHGIVPEAATEQLNTATARLSVIQDDAGRDPLPAAAELGLLFENDTVQGEPGHPAIAAGQGDPGRASGLSPPRLVRSLESIQQLKVGEYNVLNLFEQVGKHVPDPDRPGYLIQVSDRKPKPEWALRQIGAIILENALDVMVLEEVEDIKAAEDLNTLYLGGAYNVFLIEGNDQRGIDIAFLVKKDIPFQIEHRTHKDETWTDPTRPGAPHKLFSRDLTSMIFRAPGKADPLFILFGTHFKSKRDRPGDPNSDILRAAQVKRTAEIIARYRKEFGAEAPIMLGGDYNGAVNEEPIFKPLYQDAGLTDSFDASPKPLSNKERITHSYHPLDGPARYSQLDALLVSKALRGTIQSAFVYRYKNPDGTEKPLPTTYEEREKNPSDHFPIVITLEFQPILTKKFPDWKPAPKPAP